ncbi:hypothetical protein [Vreelandella massiliensis]|uniref:hypothetical protein n=1 Tax=Vreelandella massiliensis TaxID=1816686 RepID=UPI00096AB9F3|nr:hypothetical protein [Halomonas massiliensis]
MHKTIELSFLPQEQFEIAYSHEVLELNRYRWLALRFLPIDPQVSRLIGEISMECVGRLCKIEDLARKMELAACVNGLKLCVPPAAFNHSKQHFFIVDEVMGRKALETAEESARETHEFFVWMIKTNATPELHPLLLSFSHQKKNEYYVLQECRKSWRKHFLHDGKYSSNYKK